MASLAQPLQPKLAAVSRAPVRLWLPQPSLSRCVRAIVARSTLVIGRDWPDSWLYNHCPATPLCSVGWVLSGHLELIEERRPAADMPGQRLPAAYFSGPWTRPTLFRNAREAHVLVLMMLPDAVQALTGLKPADWINRFDSLPFALGGDWPVLSEAIQAAPDDPSRVALIEAFLLPRWQAARPKADAPAMLRARDWTQALAMRAACSGAGRSLRQVERRIKGWTGLPLRELRGLSRAEQAFFRALAQGEEPARWADVAADTGYADQSHLCRETRRVTGFAPGELRQRIAEDESFWLYRVWT